MQSKDKCVYLHKDKEGVVRYVGSGTEYRANKTYAYSQRGSKYADFVNTNGALEVEIVAKGLNKDEAENIERAFYDIHFETTLNMSRPSSVKSMTKEMFNEYLTYDETSKSCLRWKADRCPWVKAETEAGSLHKNGYYLVWLCGKYYRAHRIIVVLHGYNVEGAVVDHIDRNKSNNKIDNLRVVTQKENCQNRNQSKLSSSNTSGVQGVSYCKHRWVAGWREEGKWKCKYFPLKNYSSSEAAFQAAVEYRKTMVELHYH